MSVAITLGLGLLTTLASAASATALVWAGFFRTHFLVITYLLVYFVFSQNTFGATEVFVSIYNRGGGMLFFSWLTWTLWALGGLALARDKLLGAKTAPCAMRPWIFGFVVLFLVHAAVGFALGLPAKDAFSGQGLIHIANMGLLALLLLRTVSTRKALELLVSTALVVIAARALFGLVRYFFFGGDPVNPYDIRQYAPGAKLTFFDINDSLIACIGAAYCGYRLLHEKLSRLEKHLYVALILVAVAVIVLSLRRTAWGGMALASALVVALAPAGKRMAVGVPMAGFLAAGLAMLMVKRLSVAWEHAGVGWSALYYDLVGGAHYGQASLRALELKLGWEAYLASPIFGQGPWGRFEGYSGFGESWHGGEGAFGFVHSGVLHVLFKSGLVGFVLLCGLLASFVWSVKRVYPALDSRARAVLVMGAAGVLFMLPDILFGTPFIQVRTTQLLGFCMALPYIAYNVGRQA